MNLLPTVEVMTVAQIINSAPRYCLTLNGPMILRQAQHNGIDRIDQMEVWFEQQSIDQGSMDMLETYQMRDPQFVLSLPWGELLGRLTLIQQAPLHNGGLMNRLTFELSEPRTGKSSIVAKLGGWVRGVFGHPFEPESQYARVDRHA